MIAQITGEFDSRLQIGPLVIPHRFVLECVVSVFSKILSTRPASFAVGRTVIAL
ncbi:MAG: hypothetical protein ACYDED_01465 [Ferrimicrobium sp.]